jgi:6-phosphogluconolactonase (cycloisomerase 2 family)
MLSPRRISALAAATAATTLLAAGGAGANELHHGLSQAGPEVYGSSGAVFVQTDNTAGNAISVYDRGWNGSLTAAGTYPTGGNGGTLSGSVVDHLASQGSLQYDAQQNELFAVNAGSDTITAFAVYGDHLRRTQVIGSGGQFPVSISVHGDLVYVLNALGGGSIQGYRLFNGYLSPIPGSGRSLGLNPTATPQFVNTPGQIAFTPDGSDLIVTTKANGNDIDVFSVGAYGLPSASPVVNSEPGDVPFGIAFQGGDKVAFSEAGPNAVQVFTLGQGGTLTAGATVATGGAATCWITADGPVLYAGNAGSATESTVLDLPFGVPALIETTTTDAGTVDSATSPDGRYLYVQTGGAGIVDEYRVGFAGSLTEIGSAAVPGAVGGEGIATS